MVGVDVVVGVEVEVVVEVDVVVEAVVGVGVEVEVGVEVGVEVEVGVVVGVEVGMTKPPPIIEHNGFRYRRMGPVGVKQGRPPKRPRINGDGVEEWLCPCCEDWKVGREFDCSASASNGLQSWCRQCRREDSRMRRAISGTGELGDWERG